MTPDRHAVATALLAAQCPAGVCARDVDQLDRALRGRLMLQAANLIANPFGLLDALGIETFDLAAFAGAMVADAPRETAE